MSRAALALSALFCLLPACGVRGQAPPPPVIAAAGDIACDPADASFNGGNGTATACRMKATSDLLLGLGLSAVLPLGDNQYEDGAAKKYQVSYAPSWGRLKAITRPVPGNHDYATPGAAAYYAYFGAAAGDPAKGYYSWDLGGWHLIALNSNCAAVGGCGAGSPQTQWLAADLAAHPGVCTLAYWHHPRFSSGLHGNDPTSDAFWQVLYAAHADVILNGHDHVYERFAPQTPAAAADPAQGIRQFTIGTGGKVLTSIQVIQPNSEVRNATAFGVLEMTLHRNGYTWRFLSDSGAVLDQGAGLCHSARWPAADLYTLPPCRVVDTRGPAGALGGPALANGSTRSFAIASTCGVPADAVAITANVTAVTPTAAGFLEIYPTGSPPTGTTTVSFRSNRTRSNNINLALGIGGGVTVRTELSAAGMVHFVLDVSGYYR